MRVSRGRGSFTAVFGLTLVAVFVLSPAGNAVAVEPTLTGSQVVSYSADMPFTSSHLVLAEGKVEQVQGGADLVRGAGALDMGDTEEGGASQEECVITPPLLATTEETATLGSEEVSFDPATCRSLFRVGTVAADPQDSTDPQDPVCSRASGVDGGVSDSTMETCEPGTQADEAGGELAGESDASSISAARAWPRRRVAVGYSAWEDPWELDVNKVQNSVNYAGSPNCASASGGSLWDRISWRFSTGWSPLYRDLDTYWGCDRVVSKTYARFRNVLFCNPFRETRTRMWPNRVEGFAGGAVGHQPLGMSKTGDCASLLKAEAKLSVRMTNNPGNRGF